MTVNETHIGKRAAISGPLATSVVGRVVAYSDRPMALIEEDDGTRWWYVAGRATPVTDLEGPLTVNDKIDAIWKRLEPTNDGQTNTDDVPNLIDALRAVLKVQARLAKARGKGTRAYTQRDAAADVLAAIEGALR